MIRNTTALTNHGDQELRKLVLDIVEHSLLAADPYHATRNLVNLNGSSLQIGDLQLDLDQFEHVYLIGAGKATYPIARALEEILGERISGGVVVLKHGSPGELKRVEVVFGAHPLPDEEGHRGARMMMDLAGKCTARDLVLAAITGGSSALLPLPVEGVSLEDKRRVNKILLYSGAEIKQINAVRKHLSQIKGGWLAKKILPATLVNLTVSDVIGDPLDYITCPTVPDTSTFDDARQIMDDFELWDRFPPAASEYLQQGGDEQETPKSFPGMPLHSFIVVNSIAACLAAERRAAELGFKPLLLTNRLKGEAREAGTFLASIAQEAAASGQPVPPPCALIAGGENTVTIHEAYGQGGPNQEFAASAALELAGLEHAVLASLDTDGTDGPTAVAGALVDSTSLGAARDLDIDLFQSLRIHDVTPALQTIGDAIITGPTGTNINDLKILLIKPS